MPIRLFLQHSVFNIWWANWRICQLFLPCFVLCLRQSVCFSCHSFWVYKILSQDAQTTCSDNRSASRRRSFHSSWLFCFKLVSRARQKLLFTLRRVRAWITLAECWPGYPNFSICQSCLCTASVLQRCAPVFLKSSRPSVTGCLSARTLQPVGWTFPTWTGWYNTTHPPTHPLLSIDAAARLGSVNRVALWYFCCRPRTLTLTS